MKLDPFLEKHRVRTGSFATEPNSPFGAFFVPYGSFELKIIADDGAESGWEHVSVSLPNRCPNWPEMCFVKGLFWGDDETVVQFHPRRSDYVNIHPHCLHMWRRVGQEFELPPQVCV